MVGGIRIAVVMDLAGQTVWARWHDLYPETFEAATRGRHPNLFNAMASL
jgi:hypothetical protein